MKKPRQCAASSAFAFRGSNPGHLCFGGVLIMRQVGAARQRVVARTCGAGVVARFAAAQAGIISLEHSRNEKPGAGPGSLSLWLYFAPIPLWLPNLLTCHSHKRAVATLYHETLCGRCCSKGRRHWANGIKNSFQPVLQFLASKGVLERADQADCARNPAKLGSVFIARRLDMDHLMHKHTENMQRVVNRGYDYRPPS